MEKQKRDQYRLILLPISPDTKMEGQFYKDGADYQVPIHYIYQMPILLDRRILVQTGALGRLTDIIDQQPYTWMVRKIPGMPILQVYFDPEITIGERDFCQEIWENLNETLCEAEGYWISHKSFNPESHSFGGTPSGWRFHVEKLLEKESVGH